MKKVCSTCRNEKALSEFRKDRRRVDGHQPHCKLCARSYHRSAYMDRYKDQVKERDSKRFKRNTGIVKSFKNEHPCIRCGEDDVICLDFHHKDPTTKKFEISNSQYRALESLLEEMQKCVILCNNCHRKLHAGRFYLEDILGGMV